VVTGTIRRGRASRVLPATVLLALAACGGGDRAPTAAREVITITTTRALPGATVGESYDQTLRATGGSGSLEWTVTGGTLPEGVTLSTGGQLFGTPTLDASHAFTVRATGAAASASADFTLVVARPPLLISTAALPEATQGTSYSHFLDVVGGEGATTWSLAAGALPTGITLSPAGILAGSASVLGDFAFRVRAVRGALAAERGLRLTVVAPPLVITTRTLPDAKVGVAYAVPLESTGGAGGNSWSIAEGALPPGLTLSPSGTIAGTPTSAGVVALTVTVASGAQRASRSLVLTVDPAGFPSTALVTMPANVFVPFLVQIARGGTVTWRFGAAPHNAVFAPVPGAPADIAIVSNVDVARTFPTLGTFRYDCTIHPGMSGVIEVKP
jgi:plastocyanin